MKRLRVSQTRPSYRQAQAWQISGDVFNEGYTADRIRPHLPEVILSAGERTPHTLHLNLLWWYLDWLVHKLVIYAYGPLAASLPLISDMELEPQNFWGLAQPCSTMFNHLSRDDLGRFAWVAQPPISILLGCWQDSCRRFPGNIPISASSHPPFEENNYTSWYTTQNLKHCHFQEKLYIRLK